MRKKRSAYQRSSENDVNVVTSRNATVRQTGNIAHKNCQTIISRITMFHIVQKRLNEKSRKDVKNYHSNLTTK